MARTGVTFEQVSAAADALAGEGKTPSITAVREKLGTGSPNTIHAHLKTWRDARPVARAEAVELPADLRNAIAHEMQKAASAARAVVQELLVQAQAEAAELARAGEELEVERDQLAEQVLVLTTERDTLLGKSHEQATALMEAAQRIEREQQAAEAARIELAKAQLKIDQANANEARYSTEISELKTALKSAEKEAVEATKTGAVANAKLEASNASPSDALARAERAEKALADATQQAALHIAEVRAEHAKLAKEMAALQAAHTQELKHSSDHATQQAERAARVEGKLAAFEEAAQKAEKLSQSDSKGSPKAR